MKMIGTSTKNVGKSTEMMKNLMNIYENLGK